VRGLGIGNKVYGIFKKNTTCILEYDYPMFYLLSNTAYKKFLISFFIIGFIAVMYTIFWYSMAIYLKNAIEDWKADRAEQGVLASHGKVEITGFPINFHIGINHPQLQIPYRTSEHQRFEKDKKWIWRGQRAVAEVRPWNFNNIKLDLSGSNRLSLKNKDTIYEFVSKAKLINIDAEMFQRNWPRKFKIRIEEIKILEKISEIETSIKSAIFSTQVLLHGRTGHSVAIKKQSRLLQMKLKGVDVPKAFKLPLDNYIDEIFAKLKITEDLNPVLSLQNLRKWRDAGGIIDIDSFGGVSGGLKTYAAGTLALDQNLQPLLAMSANFEGIIPLIDRLKKSGFIQSNTALLAKVILGGISKRSANGKRIVSLPLTIQDRKLSIGPVSLMAIPFINWDKGLLPMTKWE